MRYLLIALLSLGLVAGCKKEEKKDAIGDAVKKAGEAAKEAGEKAEGAAEEAAKEAE